MKSIIQRDERCYLCGRQHGLETHHIMAGVANRRLSEKYGLTVLLCHDCHTGSRKGAQYEAQVNQMLKRHAQSAFESEYGHERWMEIFGKNYL